MEYEGEKAQPTKGPVQEERAVDFLIYSSPDGNVRVEAFLHDENIWLTQKKIAELFMIDRSVITKHLKNIFENGELSEASVSAKFAHTAADGKQYTTSYYNLDAIISVGYRVNTRQATQFRIWATRVLKEYIIKGFALDEDRLKNGKHFGKDYFEDLLERVRSIRASERRVYQKITDIFAECSVDYDPQSKITADFYASVQNKFHFAITGQTAAEIIYKKADAKKTNMGLTTWKHAPNGRILKSDAMIAKNYLVEKEIKRLERTVSSFFDYIERIIETRTLMKMHDLAESLNKFLEFNEFRVLEGKGKISFKQAEEKASEEYDLFNKNHSIESDFDRFSKKLLGRAKDGL